MIKNIATNDMTMTNGATPVTLDDIGWVWADCVLESKEDRGTFTSLVNAGLARHDGSKGREACVTLTQAGLDLFKTL